MDKFRERIVECSMRLDRPLKLNDHDITCYAVVEFGDFTAKIEFDWDVLRSITSRQERTKAKVVEFADGSLELTHLVVEGHMIEVKTRS